MLVITGIFDNERFIPDRPVSLPQKKKVVVTIEEEKNTEAKPEMSWRELCDAIMECDEELPGWPTSIKFRTPDEIEAL